MIKINTAYRSTQNSYSGVTPKYIVIHNTDNYAAGANALAHARAQHDGNFSGYSCHLYVDDAEAYEAMPSNYGAWHVGVNYGGRLFGTVNNHNCYGIEMCVQKGYNYEKAFLNTVDVCKQKMKELGIDADHVVSHFDVCAKNCPSAIRAHGDWNRFKSLISGGSSGSGSNSTDSGCRNYLQLGDEGNDVKEMQSMLIKCGFSCGVSGADGDFGKATEQALKDFQKANGLIVDGLYGANSRSKLTSVYKSINTPKVLYTVQCGAYTTKKNADALVDKLKKAEFDAFVAKDGNMYKIQAGAYTEKWYAQEQQTKLKKAGFPAIIKTK